MSFEAKLVELGIELPPAAKAIGAYKPLVLVGNLAHLSGHLPTHPDGSLIVGRVGEDVDVQAGFHRLFGVFDRSAAKRRGMDEHGDLRLAALVVVGDIFGKDSLYCFQLSGRDINHYDPLWL